MSNDTAITTSQPIEQHRAGRPTICILALSAIADDPRVRRQAEAFHQSGWRVVAVGLPGAHSPAPAWPILTCDRRPPSQLSVAEPAPATTAASDRPPSWRTRLARRLPMLRPLARGSLRICRMMLFPVAYGRNLLRSTFRGRVHYALRLLAVRLRRKVAQDIYWSFSENIRHIYDRGRGTGAAIWLANDWTMLPAAARLAREEGGLYGYDTHEFATEEYADRWRWRLWHRPMVQALEREYIGGAAAVSAVSEGIALRLDRLYRRPTASLVIRNTPFFEKHAFRPTAARPIRVLYHGILAPGRGLEASIDSVASWRPEFELTIRGPGEAAYVEALRSRIAERGLARRITIVPPVPMVALVREAAVFDIGFFALPGTSRHNEFALPNKFFEYLMAGLALCTTDLPEMGRSIRERGLGATFGRVDPAMIAAAINGLDCGTIDRCKKNALAAAAELCWERESERLVGTYAALLASPKSQAA